MSISKYYDETFVYSFDSATDTLTMSVNPEGNHAVLDPAYAQDLLAQPHVTINPCPWQEVKNNVKHLIIDEGVTWIENSQYDGMPNLEDVYFKEGVISIYEGGMYGTGAFSSCPKLGKVIFPESLIYIGGYTFKFLASLHEMVFKSTPIMDNHGDPIIVTEQPLSVKCLKGVIDIFGSGFNHPFSSPGTITFKYTSEFSTEWESFISTNSDRIANDAFIHDIEFELFTPTEDDLAIIIPGSEPEEPEEPVDVTNSRVLNYAGLSHLVTKIKAYVIAEIKSTASSTAESLANPVNITIGNKTVSFDGSGDITFPLDDIGVEDPEAIDDDTIDNLFEEDTTN